MHVNPSHHEIDRHTQEPIDQTKGYGYRTHASLYAQDIYPDDHQYPNVITTIPNHLMNHQAKSD